MQQVDSPVTVLGRGAEADVVVDDSGVSRRHAEIHIEGDRVRVIDLGSTNGTRVNGTTVTTSWLHPGDRIDMGSSVLVFHTDEG